MENENQIDAIKKLEDGWYKKEFSTIDIGDERLNKRAMKLVGDLSGQLSAPINQVDSEWKAVKAGYSFFDNEKVTPAKIFSPHIENTLSRMKNHEKVLAIQDTTTFNYGTHGAVEGLGNIGKKGTRGFMQHNTLIVTPNGLPLGLIDQETWSRPEIIEEKKQNKAKNIEEKESSKWLKSLRTTTQRTPEGTEVITVCDREADIFEFFDEAEKQQAKILVRLKVDRTIDNSMLSIKNYLNEQTPIGEYDFVVPKKKGEYPSRKTKIEVRYASVTLKAPKHLQFAVGNTEIEMNVINVKEINVPKGQKPIEWFLLTNDDVDCAEDALEKVMWYKTRWMIEIYHKVQKSCCKIEDCRLETKERLLRYIALKSIIAWRVLWLTYFNRVEPDAPADKILSKLEIYVLEAKTNKDRKKGTLPKKIKKVRQAVRAIASLGGFIGRVSDKEPGIITVYRGLERLHDLMEGAELALAHKVMGNR